MFEAPFVLLPNPHHAFQSSRRNAQELKWFNVGVLARIDLYLGTGQGRSEGRK